MNRDDCRKPGAPNNMTVELKGRDHSLFYGTLPLIMTREI